MRTESPTTSPSRAHLSSGAVVARLTARRAVRSGALWGYIFGAGIASSALSYTKIYKTVAERDALALAYGSNKATSSLFGPAPGLQTVGGFTVFKISMTLIVLGAVWGLLTSTRLLRGEEDSGRWELMLTGLTTRRGAAAQALLGLGVGAFVLWALTSALTVLTGRDADVKIAATPALYFALAMVATPVMFLAVGALTSQLAATRRQAAAYASAFLGATYGMRMIADAGVGLHGLIWASPIGWVEELQPLTSPRPLALVPIVLFTSVLAITTVRLAEARDVGASILADHAGVRSHPSLLSSPMGLAARLARPAVVGWWITIGTAGLLYGLIAKSAGSTISGSSVRQVFTKLGARGSGSAEVLGVCFLFIAVLIAFVAAGQLSAARAEEAEGRLDNILVRPVARSSWLAGRLTISLGAIIASGVLAGLAAWLGEASQHAGVSFATMLDAGANVVPPAVAILGLGTLVFGISPRKTSVVTYAVLGWSLVVVIVGGIGAVNHWLLDTSVFHEMASAPAVAPRWQANAVMVGAGLVGACLGGLAFRRRDLKGE